jgi:acyl-coenzyme A thioesterase PaaI-like protein
MPDDDTANNIPAATDDTADGISCYYLRMEPNEVGRTSLLDSHAVFGALSGKGLIERYNVYRRVNLGGEKLLSKSSSKQELTVVDLKLGSRLNGHGGIAHGGIISLLFDEAMGWAYECLQEDSNIDSSAFTAVTANLTVDFRAPFMECSEAILRVYHDETNGRKIYFSASLESLDGSILFAEAKSLFILIRSDRLGSISDQK